MATTPKTQKKAKTQKRRGRPTGKAKVTSKTKINTFTTNDIVAGKKLISTVGGVKKAKQLVALIGWTKAA